MRGFYIFSLLAFWARQLVVGSFVDEFRQICAIIVLGADSVAFLRAFRCFSFVDHFSAVFFGDFNGLTFLHVVELNHVSTSPLLNGCQ